MATKTTKSEEVEIIRVERGLIEFCVIGSTPLILNRLSEKTKHELLMPKKKTQADRESNLKHNPIEEYRNAAHWMEDPKMQLLAIPSTAFKGAMMTAALDMPGAKKTEVGRRVFVNNDYVEIYGVPNLFMTPVRSSDMNRTPDIRTRVIVPKWAAIVSVQFAKPLVKEKDIINLFAAAGMIAGVGDFRPEKGKGTYGQFELTTEHDQLFLAIKKAGNRKAQIEAFDTPKPYNEESRELFGWFKTESYNRGWEFDDNGRARNIEATTTKAPKIKKAA